VFEAYAQKLREHQLRRKAAIHGLFAIALIAPVVVVLAVVRFDLGGHLGSTTVAAYQSSTVRGLDMPARLTPVPLALNL